MKNIRSFGSVERRPWGRYRARLSRNEGWKDLGHYDTKEEAERALQEYMEKNNINVDENVDEVGQNSKPFVEMTKDTAEISTGVVDKPITNWDSILEGFGLDPDSFEVVDDKIRMSKWQTSKRLENGDRDIIWLYAYKALFKKKKTPKLKDSDLDEIRKVIRAFKPEHKVIKDAPKQSFVICWADWQIAKSASGGVRALTERVLKSFEDTKKRIKDLQKTGHNIDEIVFANLGDVIESCSGHYASQLFSVELTQRQQLLLALDLWVKGIQIIAPLAPKARFISTLSNHGEWTRGTSNKAMTTDSDNADGFLADALYRIMKDDEHITEWVIPHDEMVVQANLSGVEVAFTHGHKISGKEFEWLRGQSLRQIKEYGTEPNLWITAHRHHFKADDFGFFTRFQCPSLDSDGTPTGGSKWYADATGIWSHPGTLTMLVGGTERGWSELEVL